MEVPKSQYTFASFIELLLSLKSKPINGLKVACFLTDYPGWQGERKPNRTLEKAFKRYGILEQLGEIYRLSAYYTDSALRNKKMATFYLYLNTESKLLLCFTDEKTEAVDQIIADIAERTSGVYYMFVSPRFFWRIKDSIIEKNPESVCNFFTAKHLRRFSQRGEIRPNFDRTIVYYGNDALKSLDEMADFYGVSPRIMRYHVPSVGTYEIKNTGCFTLTNPTNLSEAINFLLKLVEFTSLNVLQDRKIIETSDFSLIPFKTERRTLEIPKLVPWVIRFARTVEFEETKFLIDSLNENGYSLLNSVLEKGSVRLNGLVLDEHKLKIFTIDFNGKEMIIAPKEKVSFDVFMRFFATILDSFDPQARAEVFA